MATKKDEKFYGLWFNIEQLAKFKVQAQLMGLTIKEAFGQALREWMTSHKDDAEKAAKELSEHIDDDQATG